MTKEKVGPNGITRLLQHSRDDRRDVLDRLFTLVYNELHRMARIRMATERPDHTLQATALVHEAFERLVDQKVAFHNQAHFLAIAAKSMRRILRDHARRSWRTSASRPAAAST